MKILIFLILSFTLSAQDTAKVYSVIENQDTLIVLGLTEAKIIDYWARKGVSSKALVESLERINQKHEERTEIQDSTMYGLQRSVLLSNEIVLRMMDENSILKIQLEDGKRKANDADRWKSKARVANGKFWGLIPITIGLFVAIIVQE